MIKYIIIRTIAIVAVLLCIINKAEAQVEDVQVAHPVYQFLVHAETRGFIEHFTLSSLPLQRSEIIAALHQIRLHNTELSSSEISTLDGYEKEFEIQKRT